MLFVNQSSKFRMKFNVSRCYDDATCSCNGRDEYFCPKTM